MIYQVKLIVRDEERDITDYQYSCHVVYHKDPNLYKMIELHQQICKEIGIEEPLPVEGDLIELTFNSTDHDQFFYDWMFLDAMHNGEIHFLYNEVEIADIFRFWDCYCLALSESMSADGQPMTITILLSPGIIKRNNLEAREKVWKVTDISQKWPEKRVTEPEEKKEPEIVEVYWKDAKGNINIDELPKDGVVTLYAKTINTQAGDKLSFTIILEDGKTLIKIEDCIVDEQGISKVENFDLKKYKKNDQTS